MQIEFLQEFVELSNDLCFSRTARRLNLSQSTLSMHMMALERDLGTQLIERGSPNTLNAKGKAFLEYAVAIINTYEEAKRTCLSLDASEIPPIRIHRMPANLNASELLLKKILEYKKAHPAVNVQLIEDPMHSSAELLNNGSVDVGIVGGSMVGDSEYLESRVGNDTNTVPFAIDRPAIWIPRSSFLAQKERISLHDLDGYTIVFMDHALHKGRKMSAQELFKRYSVNCRYSVRSSFSEDEFFMSTFKNGEVFFAQQSFLEKNPIVQLRDDMTVLLFEEPIETKFYLGYRKNDSNPELIRLVNFFTSE